MKNYQARELTFWTSSQILGREMHAPSFRGHFQTSQSFKMWSQTSWPPKRALSPAWLAVGYSMLGKKILRMTPPSIPKFDLEDTENGCHCSCIKDDQRLCH